MRAVRAILTAACLGAAVLVALGVRMAVADDPRPGVGTATPARANAATSRPAARPADASASRAPAPGDAALAAQKQLAAKLRVLKVTSLAAALDHNRAEWTSLSPDQRSRFRQEALAFLSQSPDQQDRLLRQYQRLIALSAERQENYRRIAQWVQVVADSMTPDERRVLLEMPPQQRAKALLDRKAELVDQGKLPPDKPATTQPAGTESGARPGD